MPKTIEVLGVTQPNLVIPDNFQLIAADTRLRNGETVRVERYQPYAPLVWLGPHLTLVWGEKGRLISFNDFSVVSRAPMTDQETARRIARETMQRLDSQYARGLKYLRTDYIVRSFIDNVHQRNDTPTWWIKYGHRNGSYNWVAVGPGGRVVEFEREALWDDAHNRRATEEWNFDNWVLARLGKGPQPEPPEAPA